MTTVVSGDLPNSATILLRLLIFCIHSQEGCALELKGEAEFAKGDTIPKMGRIFSEMSLAVLNEFEMWASGDLLAVAYGQFWQASRFTNQYLQENKTKSGKDA